MKRQRIFITMAAVLAMMATLYFAGCGGGGGGDPGLTARLAAVNLGTFNPFELDGNVADDTVTGEDWATTYTAQQGAGTTAAIAYGFSEREYVGSAEESFFTGGGSKDEALISQWNWDDVSDVIPDKDDISQAFVAAYDHPGTGHTLVYFGADRFDTSGSAEIGFWFFRERVHPGVKPNFVGQHSVGDILVLANFVNGGKVGLVDVYKWVGGKNPLLRLPFDGVDCADAQENDVVCATINRAAGEVPPWSYLNKDGQNAYQVGALFEGGIDLTEMLGEAHGCFTSFVAETRSSHSLSAQLKDFAFGDFPMCGIAIDKTGDELSKIGDPVNYEITISNTGRAPLYKKEIRDSLIGDITLSGADQNNAAVSSNTCGPMLAPAASCTIAYSRVVGANDPDPLENTARIIYTEFADFSGVAFPAEYTWTTNLFQPAIAIDKKANGSDGPLTVDQGDTVNYMIRLTNNSSADTPDLICQVTDPLGSINQSVTLASGGTFDIGYNQTFVVAPATIDNTASVSCSPDGFPNVLEDHDSVTVIVEPAVVMLSVAKDGPDYSKAGDNADYTIVITNLHTENAVTLTSIIDSLSGDLTDGTNSVIVDSDCPIDPASLAPGLSCTIHTRHTVQTSDLDPLVNIVTVNGHDIFNNTPAELPSDSHVVDLVHPAFTVAKTCLSDYVPIGASVNFRIDFVNTGDVPLLLDISDPAIGINLVDVLLGARGAAACSEDDFINSSVGCLRLEGSTIATADQVLNTVSGQATLPAEYALANVYPFESGASCSAGGVDGATRTWGFWKTHGSDGNRFDLPVAYGYTGHVFQRHLGGTIDLGWVTVDSIEELFGLFWAQPAKNSDGSKRSQLCMSKLHASHQLLAAILNSGLSNAAPVPEGLISATQAALAGSDRREIIRLSGLLADYNESGDAVAIVDADGAGIPHADPRGTRGIMDASAADCQ